MNKIELLKEIGKIRQEFYNILSDSAILFDKMEKFSDIIQTLMEKIDAKEDNQNPK